MTRTLDRVDRLMGDADKASLSLPSPFGNRHKAPYWTGWSFDACMVIAILYPVGALIVTWVYTGDAGDVGAVLGLLPHAAPHLRILTAGALALAGVGFYRFALAEGWRSPLWYKVAFVVPWAFAVAVAFTFAVGGPAVAI